MNIVMVGPFGLHPKGTMRARALPAARALDSRGHHVTLLMPPWHTPERAGRSWTDDRSSVRIEYVGLQGLAVPGVGHLLLALSMARRAATLRPDVVHAFKPKAYSGLAALILRAGQWLGGEYALVVDSDDWEGAGGWNDLEPYSGPMRRFFSWQERWGLRHADAVTVASCALESLAWSLGVPNRSVFYLPNGVEAAARPPAAQSTVAGSPGTGGGGADRDRPAVAAASGGDGDARLLLYTRFFEFDPKRALDVLARVLERHPKTRLVVVGKGLFGEEERFQEMARRRGLSDAVDYRGWLEAEALASVFREADIALWPFDDNLVNRTKSSVKLLELMAAGVAVVADDVGQNGEVIEDGASGRLVAAVDVDAFATVVCELIDAPEQRRRLAEGAKERVRAAFTWDRLSGRLEQVYECALRERRPGPPKGTPSP